MYRLRLALVTLAAILQPACRIEDRSPEGSRRDEEQIRGVIAAYYDGVGSQSWASARPLFWDSATVQVRAANDTAWRQFRDPDAYGAFLAVRPGPHIAARPIRMDARQEEDVATVWVEVRRGEGGERTAEHFALRKMDGAWRIVGMVGGER